MKELKNRKSPRLQGFDYNNVGAYFITICTKDRQCILSRIVGTGVPTADITTRQSRANSVFSQFVSTLKRFCNKECGENIWQTRAHDHVIRNQEDYEKHLKYI